VSNFSALSWQEQVTFWRDRDDVHFVLDQHDKLNPYSVSSLKQQSTSRYVGVFRQIILT